MRGGQLWRLGAAPSLAEDRARSRRAASRRRARLEPLEPRQLLAADVVISEFLAGNSTGIVDKYGAHSDWIELHNTSVNSVNLLGWHLTDNASDPTQWTFPDVQLAADGFLVVFASNKNQTLAGSELHTNFKLNTDGEYLALIRPDGTVAHEYGPQYLQQVEDISYGIGDQLFTKTLVGSSAASRFLVPSNSNLGSNWTQLGFDDSSWTNVTPAVGFGPLSAPMSPVGYWNLNDTTADTSGHGFNGTAVGATYSTDVAAVLGGGKSLSFNGGANYFMTPNLAGEFAGNDTVTLSVWFKARAGGNGGVVVDEIGQPTINVGWHDSQIEVQSTGEVRVRVWSLPSVTVGTASFGQWNHAVLRYDKATQRLDGFLNGVPSVQSVTQDRTAPFENGNQQIYALGATDSTSLGNAKYFDGQIDDFVVWNKALTNAQVAWLYQGAAPLSMQYVPPDPDGLAGQTATNVAAVMAGVNASAYLRTSFQVASLADYNSLTLRVKYDDGFVAYLNGQEIARRNAPASVLWNSPATGEHANALAVKFEEIDVSAYLSSLRAGPNVLAFQGLNAAAANGDFLLGAQLVDFDVTSSNLGYFAQPTPGLRNALGAPDIAPQPEFSVAGGSFLNSVTVALSSADPLAVIRYTVNGTQPTDTSPVYSGPLLVSNTTLVRARSFVPGEVPSPIVAENYVRLAADVQTFSSNLPVLVINTFGQNVVDSAYTTVYADLYNTPGQRNALTDVPDFTGSAALKIRGSSSQSFPKKSYAFEIRDQAGNDKDVSLLGMPSDSDWVLYAPYTDKTLMRDVLSYQWSNDIGDYAVRTRYVEVYVDTDAGQLTKGSYQGVYVLEEKIKRGSDRVDIAETGVSEPEISGGYIMKFDRLDPGDAGLTTSRGYTMGYVEPKEEDATPAQEAWIKGYLDQFETALYGANFADPINGYQKYIDVDAFIDHHILVELTKNIDGFRLSTFLHKDRDGKLKMGPIWDYNLSLGNANYYTGWSPQGWYHTIIGGTAYPWWDRLFQDPNFQQKYTDRWAELRKGAFNTATMLGKIDADRTTLAEAEVRDHQRWPILGQYVWPNVYFGAPNNGDMPPGEVHPALTYNDEITFMKNWLRDRLTWIDSQYLISPAFNQDGGPITAGFGLTMTSGLGAIYYTLDGTDPRLPGGGIKPGALTYGSSVALGQNTHVIARLKNGNLWSAPHDAVFVVSTPKLVVSEIMYHPTDPPAGSLYADEEFEFIELQNVGSQPMALGGARLTGAVEFTFPAMSLAAGQYVLVVSNQAAFESRYGRLLNVAGQYLDRIDNNGERITLLGPVGEPILDFAFFDTWVPSTDGLGRSMVIVDPTAPLPSWGEAASWRESSFEGGSPGAVDPYVTVSGRFLFYNGSVFDRDDAAASVTDDAALATDKAALRAPQLTASAANVSSYTRGINGMFVDIRNPLAEPLLSDFAFRVGNDNNPAAWTDAPLPSIFNVRSSVGGASRVTLIWDDNAIINQWLQVTVKANAPLGLATPDVFYFGSAVGEAGNGADDFYVNASDEILARQNPATFVNPAAINNRFDFNRDGFVNAADQIIARSNATSLDGALKLLSLAGPAINAAEPPQLNAILAGVALSQAAQSDKAVGSRRLVTRELPLEEAADDHPITAPSQFVSGPTSGGSPSVRSGDGDSWEPLDDELLELLAGGALQ